MTTGPSTSRSIASASPTARSADIGVDDIKPIVKPVWDSGHTNTARRLLRHIESTLDYAKAHGWRKADNPAAWGVFEHILQAQGPSGPKSHHPALKWPETPAFMARLRAAEPTMPALALEMMVLTACRSGEVRGMQWDEIDFDTATWTVPAERMKRKLEHEVPLSADAMALIRRLEAAPDRQVRVSRSPRQRAGHQLSGVGPRPAPDRARR